MAQRYACEMAQNGKRAAVWSTDDDRDLMARATMVMVYWRHEREAHEAEEACRAAEAWAAAAALVEAEVVGRR
jgi:hypothetical protein